MGALPVYRNTTLDFSDSQRFHHNLRKPSLLAIAWEERGFPVEFLEAEPFTPAQMSKVHDPRYVEDILSGQRTNGFQTSDREVPDMDLWSAGALRDACIRVLDTRGVGCVLGGMGHHAHFSLERGYCTFHGGMAAIVDLLQSGVIARAGILDYDFHEGDGTNHIIKTLELDSVVHYSSAYEFDQASQAKQFLDSIDSHFEQFRTCDVMIYHCGVDPHVDDQVGGWLTTEEMREREYRVFAAARSRNIPLVWCLGGGYQRDACGQPETEKIVALHTLTLEEYLRVYA